MGGARSGKSDFAVKLAQDIGGECLFVATARAEDEEMQTRITAHQAQRPRKWRTLEVTEQIADALEVEAHKASVVLLDSVTLWVASVLASASPHGLDQPDAAAAESALAAELGGFHDWYRGSAGSVIVVSDEVGMGLVPESASGRAFRDLLGGANQRLATIATEAYLLVAGIPVELKQLAARPWRQDTPYDEPRL